MSGRCELCGAYRQSGGPCANGCVNLERAATAPARREARRARSALLLGARSATQAPPPRLRPAPARWREAVNALLDRWHRELPDIHKAEALAYLEDALADARSELRALEETNADV